MYHVVSPLVMVAFYSTHQGRFALPMNKEETQACSLLLQARAASLEAPEWERRVQQYAALAEQIAAQAQHTDLGCIRVNAEEIAAAAAQHAQEWVRMLLEAIYAQELVQIEVCAEPSPLSLNRVTRITFGIKSTDSQDDQCEAEAAVCAIKCFVV